MVLESLVELVTGAVFSTPLSAPCSRAATKNKKKRTEYEEDGKCCAMHTKNDKLVKQKTCAQLLVSFLPAFLAHRCRAWPSFGVASLAITSP